jgi:hypothetical protein
MCTLQEIHLDVNTCPCVWSDSRMVSDSFISKNMVPCVLEQCILLSDWLKLVCCVTTKTFACMYWGLCWRNVVLCVIISRSISSCSFKFLSSLWLSVSKTGQGITSQIAQGNFITDAWEWIFYVLNACGSSIFVF